MEYADEPDTLEDTVAEASLDELVAKFFGPTPPAVHVQVAGISHPGKVRPNNEDHYVAVRRRRSREVLATNLPDGFLPPSDESAYALVVADGIGGAAFGELASTLALQTAWDLTTQAFKWHFRVDEREAQEIQEKLRVYGQLMHRALVERAEADPRLAGMGTTIAGAINVGREVFIAHVGDSRAYLFRGESLERLTRDHTMAQQLVDAGVLSSVSEASRAMRNMLVNCLGGRGQDEVEVDVRHIEVSDGDRLLLCTDGLTDMVEEPEIAAVLRRHSEPNEACRVLVDLALDHGGRDNITIIVAKYTIPEA